MSEPMNLVDQIRDRLNRTNPEAPPDGDDQQGGAPDPRDEFARLFELSGTVGEPVTPFDR